MRNRINRGCGFSIFVQVIRCADASYPLAFIPGRTSCVVDRSNCIICSDPVSGFCGACMAQEDIAL